MQVAAASGVEPELLALLATLCSYEMLFGPYHPQTLRLMIQVGEKLWRHGERVPGRLLLERVASDLMKGSGTRA